MISNRYPGNYDERDINKFRDFISYAEPGFSKRKVSNHFVTNSGIVFSIRSGLVQGSVFPGIGKKMYFIKVAAGNFLLKKKLSLHSKDYLLIHNLWSIGGYYHWLVESLVRLWRYREQLDDLILLLPERAKKHSFIQDSLQLFDVKNVYYTPSDKLMKVGNLHLADNPEMTGYHNAGYLRALRQYLVSQVSNHPVKSYPERIYVSRQRARSRKIVNNAALENVLKDHGFTTLYMEDLTFTEQIAVFSQAEVIISPHGAALTNMMFMKKGAAVLELISEKVDAYMIYWSLANALQLEYYYFLCPQANDSQSFDLADLHAPLTQISNFLSTLNQRD